ncbi:hypothetical protein D1007_45469 [Hordeum vulgare]|nr:hypothetical protein D1007_45469 [Hordeum vulgare]
MEGEDVPSLKGKRAASEDAEAKTRSEGLKRLKITLVRAADKPSKKIILSDEFEDDRLALGEKTRTSRVSNSAPGSISEEIAEMNRKLERSEKHLDRMNQQFKQPQGIGR